MPLQVMPPWVEGNADAALVAVLGEDEQVLGTGFVIDDSGSVLTCHHVVDGLASVGVRGPDGLIRVADDVITAADVDLALIRVHGLAARPLPLAAQSQAATAYWTKGFHRYGEEIRASFPVRGTITGRTSVSYAGYDIDGVLVLRDDVIDEGLSGAPVLDPAAGVVIGVVSANLLNDVPTGLAVPIERAAAHPALARDVAANQETVPAYGAYLNGAAARRLCAEATESEVQVLADLRGLDLARRVSRTEVEAALRGFLADDGPIFALVGPSGTGKSTELAAFARQLPGRVLLLRGSSIQPGRAGLGQALEDVLANAAGDPLPEAAGQAVARALPSDAALVIVLDALNEAPLSGQAFQEWVADARSWLQKTPARLVVSCRPELWDDVVGRPLTQKLQGRQPVVTRLGGFTEQEFTEATRAYRLPDSLNSPILRLPLALNLWASLDQDRGPLAMDEVISAYVLDACRRLAVKQAGPQSAPAVIIREMLLETAAQMWRQDTQVLGIPAISQILGNTASVGALVSEGLMSATPDGLRFVYDEIADWLMTQRIDVDEELSGFVQRSDISWRKIGPVSAALRDIESREGTQALASRLQQLVEDTPVDGPAFHLAKITFARIADPQNYLEVLECMARRVVSYLSGAAPRLDAIVLFADDFWTTIPLPTRQRIRLLHDFIRFEGYYPWRPMDWSSWGLWDNSFSWRQSVSVGRVIAQDPEPGLEELVSWLDDGTALGGGEATIAHVAMGILYHLRESLGPAVWLILMKFMEKCDPLIKRLADDDPRWLARMISDEVPVAGDEALIVYGAAQLAGSKSLSAEQHQAVRLAVAQRYAAGLSPPALGWALNVLSQDPAAVRQFAAGLIQAYRDGIPGINEYSLVRAAEDGAVDIVLPALIADLDPGSGRRREALAAMAKSADTAIQAAADREVLRQLEDRTAAVDLYLCRYAEDRLYKTAQASADLLAIVRHVISAPPGPGRAALAYPLAGPAGLGDMTQRRTLLVEFIEASPDHSAQAEVIRMLARSAVGDPQRGGKKLPGAFDLFELVLARIDPSLADDLLFREAHKGAGFADVLAQWLTTGRLTPPGDLTRRLMAYVGSGMDPENAASQVRQDEIAGPG